MKQTVCVTLEFVLEYECEEHRQHLMQALRKKYGMHGLSGAGISDDGKAHGYRIIPADAQTSTVVVKDLP